MLELFEENKENPQIADEVMKAPPEECKNTLEKTSKKEPKNYIIACDACCNDNKVDEIVYELKDTISQIFKNQDVDFNFRA